MSSPKTDKDAILHNKFKKECLPYCSHITQAMSEISPMVFNQQMCLRQCIKHRGRKLRRKLYEKKKLEKEKLNK